MRSRGEENGGEQALDYSGSGVKYMDGATISVAFRNFYGTAASKPTAGGVSADKVGVAKIGPGGRGVGRGAVLFLNVACDGVRRGWCSQNFGENPGFAAMIFRHCNPAGAGTTRGR